MAEDNDGSGAGPGGANPAATAISLTGAALDPRAREYLEEQTRLTRLQIEDLKREDRLRHWSLIVHHVNDVMKLAFQFAGAFIVLALAAFIGAAIWNAANDNSLVIDAFSVPPDMAAKGLTGQAVAAQLQDKLAAMQEQTDSARPANSYANNWGDDIKVQIPDTGVSIGEFYRMLTLWLGHQTHISGEVWHTGKGLAITARVTGSTGDVVLGSEDDFGNLMQRAAEAIYARTQTYRYAIYLGNGPGKIGEQIAMLRDLAINGSPRDRVWAHIGLATIMSIETDPLNAPAEQRKAIPLAPDLALIYQNLGQFESALGHDEAVLANQRRAVERLQVDDGQITERARQLSLPSSLAAVAEYTGDYQAALASYSTASVMPDYSFIVEFARESMKVDYAGLHDFSAARRIHVKAPAAGGPGFAAVLAQRGLFAASLAQDWPAVLAQGKRQQAAVRELLSQPGYTKAFVNVTLTRQLWPFIARAMAMTGDISGAEGLIGKTPLDCYPCVLNRANIVAAARDWPAADKWFAQAVKQAPSIPFAYADWGRLLLARGQYDAAIAKFTLANQKGPHFADPLEMWGEALMQKNRSDLAIAKFEDADKYAPHWGRLHLKWGQALLYTGDKADAQKQFALAAHFDLTPSEKSELSRIKGSHG